MKMVVHGQQQQHKHAHLSYKNLPSPLSQRLLPVAGAAFDWCTSCSHQRSKSPLPFVSSQHTAQLYCTTLQHSETSSITP